MHNHPFAHVEETNERRLNFRFSLTLIWQIFVKFAWGSNWPDYCLVAKPYTRHSMAIYSRWRFSTAILDPIWNVSSETAHVIILLLLCRQKSSARIRRTYRKAEKFGEFIDRPPTENSKFSLYSVYTVYEHPERCGWTVYLRIDVCE